MQIHGRRLRNRPACAAGRLAVVQVDGHPSQMTATDASSRSCRFGILKTEILPFTYAPAVAISTFKQRPVAFRNSQATRRHHRLMFEAAPIIKF